MNHTNYMCMCNILDKFCKYKETDSLVISVDFPSESRVLQGRSSVKAQLLQRPFIYH